MSIFSKSSRALMPALASLLIVACGGGESSDDSATAAPVTPPGSSTGSPSQPPTTDPLRPPVTGLGWKAGSSIATPSATDVYAPVLGVAPTGQAHVMWLQEDGRATGAIYTTQAALADGQWATPVLLAQGPAHAFSGASSLTGLGEADNPMALLPLGTRGDMLAVWRTQERGSAAALMMRRFSASAQQWTAPEALAAQAQGRLRTASSSQGHAVVAWETADTTQLLVIDGQMQRRGLTLPARSVQNLAINAHGTVAATWTDGNAQYLAVSNAASWAQPIQLPSHTVAGTGWTDLRLEDDGELALAWTLESHYIASYLLRADGRSEQPAPVRAQNSSGKPSLARTSAGWQMAFVGSQHAPRDFPTSSVLMNAPFHTAHSWGVGWSTPSAIHSTGPAGTGRIELLRTQADELTAVVTGYNVAGYSRSSADGRWNAATIAFDGRRPAVAAPGATGQAVAAWSDDGLLKTYFRR